MNSNKSILHVVNIYFVLPYFIGDQFLYFNQKGYKIHVICSPSEQIENYSKEKGFSFKQVLILRSISIFQDVKSIISICNYIRKKNIDIVIGHTPKGALLSMIAAFLTRVPKRIYFRHGLVYETSTGFKRKLLISIDKLTSKLATQIVCVSPSVCRRSLEDKLNKEEKQVILSRGTCNGVDTDRFNRSSIDLSIKFELKRILNIPEDSFVIGYTGRLVRDKGIVELVDAFINLSKEYENVYLLLVGMLEKRDALPLETIKLINDNTHIINPGLIENREIEYYYSLMDVFTLPSYREGFPTSVLEASSMELPVITTKVTGCVDSIIENKSGLFVKHSSVEVFDAIKTFILDSSKKSEFGKAGRQYMLKYFDQKIIWECIEDLYKDN